MKTTLMSSPCRALSSFTCARTGDGSGEMRSVHSGMYLRMKSTHAGQAEEIITEVRGDSAKRRFTWDETDSAPCAVSETPSKPASASAPARRSMETPLK